MDTHAPPGETKDAKRIRLAAHTAGTCLTPGEQMRVRASFLGVGKTLPPRSVFAKPLEAEPHVHTDLGEWTRQMRKIAATPDAPFRMFHKGGVDYIVDAKVRNPRTLPEIHNGAARDRAPRSSRRARVHGVRAGPDSSPSGSPDDDPDPDGLRVSHTWRPLGVTEPPEDVTTPTKAVTS
jgi:hypothetical protein